MTDTTTMSADQINALTPDEATALLGQMTADHAAANRPPTGTPAIEAHARLAELAADPEWSQKLLDSDADTRREFDRLTALVASGSDADLALAGIMPKNHIDYGPGASLRNQIETVPLLRQMGVNDESIRQLLEGSPVTKAEHALAVQWRDQHMGDAEWRGKLLSGDYDARRELTLASIIMAAGVK
jgi:hypothetical protein